MPATRDHIEAEARGDQAGDRWIAIADRTLPIAEAQAWVVRPDCGAVVCFVGTVRDHAAGRPGVTELDYEAYPEAALGRMTAIADEITTHWPTVRRIALLHRTGKLEVTDAAVVVAVSAAHRGEAFDAAEWAIDTLKATVPIWKKETWADGSDWSAA
jgi:molybdopterin synthase catalytic subunit